MFGISSIDLASIIVALIAGAVALSTARASNKASKLNVQTTSRVDMEKEAYQRARALDTGTIERQDAEIEELRQELKELKRSHAEELKEVRRRLWAVERENAELRKLVPLEMHPELDHGEGDN